MDTLQQLTALFSKFPGIGPRQAGRFVQYLLRSSPSLRRELINALQELGSAVHECPSCMRFHAGSDALCSMCANPKRDIGTLAVVATDADLLALERSHTYAGFYFVLGGTISLASEKATHLRIPQLKKNIEKNKKLSEIIIAFPINPEGDATAIKVREELENIAAERGIKVSMLGRGLSTGSELEYADPETLKSAFDSRK